MLPYHFGYQSLKLAESKNEFRENSRELTGLFVSCMLLFRGIYVHVLSLGTNWKNLTVTNIWHPHKYNKLGQDGKFVIGLYKLDPLWELHLANNTGVTDQDISMFENWSSLETYIHEQWKNGYDITDLLLDDGKYYVVSSLGLNLNQSWLIDSGWPWEKIRNQGNKGRIVTEITKVGDEYLWIFSGNTAFKETLIVYHPSDSEITEIRTKLLSDDKYDGFSLSLVRELDGKLIFIFVK